MIEFILSFLMALPVSASTTLTEEIDQFKARGKKKRSEVVAREFGRANKELKESGIEEKAIQKGAKAPSFKLGTLDFKEFYTKQPVILKFYRGSWCPYCRMELKAYEAHKKQFSAKGYQIIILTPDTMKEIRKFKDKEKISFQIFQDINNGIAKKFGIAFKVDKKVLELYKNWNIDLQRSQENNNGELPMPGTYVINKEGIITYAFFDTDYTKRVDPLDLLKEL